MKFYQNIFGLLLLLPSISFAENWIEMSPEYSDEKGVYIDVDSIQKLNSKHLTYELKRIYNKPQSFDEHRQYTYQVVTIKVDCKKQKMTALQSAFYDKENQLIFQHKNPNIVWQDVGKMPALNARLQFVCNYKTKL